MRQVMKSARGYTNFSDMSNDTYLRRIAMGSPSQMKLFVVEVTQVRLSHTSGFMSFVAVYSLNEMCETKEKEMFHAKDDFIFNQKLS